MSKHRRVGPQYDSAYETAKFLAEVAVNSVLEQYGHQPAHAEDVSVAMLNAIEVAAETVDTIGVRSR